ncbi:hypothetical protein ABFT23_06510 [Nocardioides sp. C4-1]|uniref:hypothetical protein n=1 Tax=Nocardioides sp. C4-1 TaxID=3151851 RepID=UPI003262EFBF
MRPVAAVLALVLTALLGSVTPARAETRTIDDGATAVPAEMDLLTVKIANKPRTVVLTATFRDLVAGRRANLRVFVDPRPGDEPGYIAYAKLNRAGRTSGTLQVATDDEFGGRPIACEGYTVTWSVEADRVRVVVPQRCLQPNGTRHRFKAVSGFWDGVRGDSTSFVTVVKGRVGRSA